jgi:periodic tryptophan protein 1
VQTDVRTPEGDAVRWEVPADVEALAWDPHSPTCFAVAVESGEVLFLDARRGAGSAPLASVAAHAKAATCLSFCPAVPGLMLTASTDKQVKLWSVPQGAAPALLASQDLKVGGVFSAAFCRDAPMVVAAGGAKGTVSVWDTRNTESVVEWAKAQGAGEAAE